MDRRARESVRRGERKKAAFLQDYKNICELHGMVIVLAEDELEKKSSYMVADSTKEPWFLENQMEQMRIANTIEL